jgi:hypothetical protein
MILLHDHHTFPEVHIKFMCYVDLQHVSDNVLQKHFLTTLPCTTNVSVNRQLM